MGLSGRRGRGSGGAPNRSASAAVLAFPLLCCAPAWASQSSPLEISRRPLAFGEVVVGEAEEIDFDAENATAGTLSVDRVSSSLSAFRVVDDGCEDRQFDPGESCTVTVEFRPRSAGAAEGDIVLETSAGDVTVPVTGTGVKTSVSSSSTDPSSTSSSSTTTTTGRSTTTTSRLSDEERLAECERRAEESRVAYEPELDMRLGETSQVRVRVSLPGSSTTATTIKGTSTTVEIAQLRCVVRAQLRSEDFTINPEDFQEGSFLDRPDIEWTWDVVPESTGQKVLTLTIQSLTEVGGREIVGGPRPYTAEIDVDAGPETVGTKVNRWSEAVVGHPLVQGLGSLLLLGATAAGAWRWLLKRPWPWKGPATASTGSPPPPVPPAPVPAKGGGGDGSSGDQDPAAGPGDPPATGS